MRRRPLQADCSSLPQRPLQAELLYFAATKIRIGRGALLRRDRRHSGGFLLRIMPPSWHPVSTCIPQRCCRRAVILAGTMVLHRFLISGPELTITATASIIPGTSVQRFLISGPELTITATASIIPATSVQRFLISGPDLAIAAAMGYIPGTSVQRFPISSPNLRIAAAKRSKQGQPLQPKGGRHCAAAGECRMGRDFGRRSRPWLRER